MKQKFRTVALFAVLSLATVGCEKEKIVDNTVVTTGEEVSMKMVTYTIDGETSQAIILSDEAWYDFLDWMFALAEEGHRVSFCCGVASERSAAKETVTFTTHNKQEAYSWVNNMALQGYQVTVDYDRTTGIYTCTATRK